MSSNPAPISDDDKVLMAKLKRHLVLSKAASATVTLADVAKLLGTTYKRTLTAWRSNPDMAHLLPKPSRIRPSAIITGVRFVATADLASKAAVAFLAVTEEEDNALGSWFFPVSPF